MANWTSLVHVAVKAEVPDYEIMQTMSLFLGELDLDERPVKRLAKFFGFSPVTHLKNDDKNCLQLLLSLQFWLQRWPMKLKELWNLTFLDIPITSNHTWPRSQGWAADANQQGPSSGGRVAAPEEDETTWGLGKSSGWPCFMDRGKCLLGWSVRKSCFNFGAF